MTPLPPPAVAPQPKGMGRGILLGVVISLAGFMVLGLFGGVVAYSRVKKAEADSRKGWNLVPIVVAAVDISESTVVTFDMISQRSVPEQFVTSSVVKPDSASYVVNQKVLVPVQAGDMLLWSMFETTKAAERLSDKVEADTRIVAIKTPREAAVGGWVRPHDHVDVIAVYTPPDSKERTAVTLLQNVRVAATGKITATTNVNLLQPPDREYSEVSLFLSPTDAEKVALMADLGTLTLSLRNENDKSAPSRPPVTVKTVGAR